MKTQTNRHTQTDTQTHRLDSRIQDYRDMGWLPFVGSLKLYVSFAKEPYKKDDILPRSYVCIDFLLWGGYHS